MVQVTVIGNDVAQSLKVLKKKMQREGIFREMKLRRCHEKNSETHRLNLKPFLTITALPYAKTCRRKNNAYRNFRIISRFR